MKESKIISGILSTTLVLILISNGVNTAFAKNNLISNKTETVEHAAKAVFLISEPSTDVILEKYANATSLTSLQLVELLKAVGFKGEGLKTAWVIAKAESNGRPLAFNGNVNTGDSSYGIYQINMLRALGPERRDKFNLDHNADLFNPVVNAQIAFHMTKKGTDWTSWSSTKNGAMNQWINKFPE